MNLTKNRNLYNLFILLLSHIKEQNDKGELILFKNSKNVMNQSKNIIKILI